MNKLEQLKREIKKEEDQRIVLEGQLQSINQVLKNTRDELDKGKNKLDEKLENMWADTLRFIDEASSFNEEYGISSPWWISQVNHFSEGDVDTSSNEKQVLRKAIEEIEISIKLSRIVEEKLKKEAYEDHRKLLELQAQEKALQQEPFSSEFLSLKSKIQRNKEACKQLTELVKSHSFGKDLGELTENSFFQNDAKELPHTVGAMSNPSIGTKPYPRTAMPLASSKTGIPRHSENVTERRFFKIREKTTTVMLRKQALKSDELSEFQK